MDNSTVKVMRPTLGAEELAGMLDDVRDELVDLRAAVEGMRKMAISGFGNQLVYEDVDGLLSLVDAKIESVWGCLPAEELGRLSQK